LFGWSKATKYCIQKDAFLRTATDKYILPIAEDSFPTPGHCRKTFGTEVFLFVPKEAAGHATQQEGSLKQKSELGSGLAV
jgi:hypothetical protein